MLRLFYQWRYRRAQRAGAFEIPPERSSPRHIYHSNFGNYLSQSSVRGRQFDRFDLPRKGRRGLRFLAVALGVLLLLWLVVESIAALAVID